MIRCFFATDLHGHEARYAKLLHAVEEEAPAAVFLGGDLLPFPFRRPAAGRSNGLEFIEGFLAPAFLALRERMRARYPRVYLILGNDDPRAVEDDVLNGQQLGIWEYAHGRKLSFETFDVFGYACVPPTPFHWKDWERYDVSRYVDPGCVSPEEGQRSVPVSPDEIRHGTILRDLERLTQGQDLEHAIFLFHAPPYQTPLDLADLEGKAVEGVPLDEHIGSIAVRRFIEERQPRVTLHGHVHEAVRLSGAWRIELGRTQCLSAAHDGPELALVRFEAENPTRATRDLL